MKWNPGNDAQAVDRVYRIGQKGENIVVYRFVTATGVEEKIYSRQVFKDSLTKQTIGKAHDELTDEQRSVQEHREAIKHSIGEVYDISEHSLVFSKQTEKLSENHADYAYLNEEVRTAREPLNLSEAGKKAGGRTQQDKNIQDVEQKLLAQRYGVKFLKSND